MISYLIGAVLFTICLAVFAHFYLNMNLESAYLFCQKFFFILIGIVHWIYRLRKNVFMVSMFLLLNELFKKYELKALKGPMFSF